MTRSSPETASADDLLERLDDQGLYNKAERIQMIKDAAAEIRRLRGLAQCAPERAWHEALADRVLRLKIGGAKTLSCDAVLGLIAFVRDGEGSVADTSTDRDGKK